MNKKKTIAFSTLGCKLNYAETSDIINKVLADNYELVPYKSIADFYVINSCSVTSLADKKTRNNIYKAYRNNPNAHIIVIGCSVQINKDDLEKMPGVSIILGNDEKFNLLKYIKQIEASEDKIIEVKNYKDIDSFFIADSTGNRTRSFLKIQDGCNYFCSYCTIPYARGKSRNAPISDVLTRLKELADKGVNEVVLSGINIGDFGKSTNESLYELLKQIKHSNYIPRIRLSSIEPDLLTNNIIELFSDSKNLMPHFHLPLQSGSNSILKLMNRKYTCKLFEERVHIINKLISNACIGVDVIVGFPNETTELFEETKLFIENLKLSYLHVFSFSAREGTTAYKMINQINPKEKEIRSKILHTLSEQKRISFFKENLGGMYNVLIEKTNKENISNGFTENYIPVFFENNINAKTNTIIKIKLIEIINDKVKGIII